MQVIIISNNLFELIDEKLFQQNCLFKGPAKNHEN